MRGFELGALAIVALYVGGRAAMEPRRGRLLLRLLLIAVASWTSEQIAISLYDAYHYEPVWWLFVGHVPLSVVLIWPCVIHGAWDLTGSLLGTRGPTAPDASAPGGLRVVVRAAWIGGLLVLADASLIEPIAVRAELWAWHRPGLFNVPLIGLVGWALHAGGCIAVLEHARVRGTRTWQDALILLSGPAATHAGLLIVWWGGMRWVAGVVEPWPAVGAAWLASVLLAVAARRSNARARIPSTELWLRVPAASFFFVLLLVYGRREVALLAYAVAFVPPWLALLRLPARGPGSLDGPGRVGYTVGQ